MAIRQYASFKDENYLYMLFDLMPGGDLKDVLGLEVPVYYPLRVEVLEDEHERRAVVAQSVLLKAHEDVALLLLPTAGLHVVLGHARVRHQNVHQVPSRHQVEEHVQVVLVLEGGVLPDSHRVGAVLRDHLLAEDVLLASDHRHLAHDFQSELAARLRLLGQPDATEGAPPDVPDYLQLQVLVLPPLPSQAALPR